MVKVHLLIMSNFPFLHFQKLFAPDVSKCICIYIWEEFKILSIVFNSNINSLRNNDLDAVFVGTFINSKMTTKIISGLKYGKNYRKKDTKEKLDFKFVSTYHMKNVIKTVNYTMEVKLPAHVSNFIISFT